MNPTCEFCSGTVVLADPRPAYRALLARPEVSQQYKAALEKRIDGYGVSRSPFTADEYEKFATLLGSGAESEALWLRVRAARHAVKVEKARAAGSVIDFETFHSLSEYFKPEFADLIHVSQSYPGVVVLGH